MTKDEITEELIKIDNMSHLEMARLWRFSPVGHIYFDRSKPFHAAFRKRFWDDFGGFTHGISKVLGYPIQEVIDEDV